MNAVKLVSVQGENKLIMIYYPKPEIKKDNQVLVKVKAVAVNPIDLQMFQGKMKQDYEFRYFGTRVGRYNRGNRK
jgi:NADPH:quinone reductase-like Zn-dependent oxidoreductase